MATSKLPIWSCFSGHAPATTPIKVVKHLLKITFNGKVKTFSFDHVLQFNLNCSNYDIEESIICIIFTLTLIRRVKD